MNASELKARAAELLPWAENCAASANTDSWRGIAAILRAVAGGAVSEPLVAMWTSGNMASEYHMWIAHEFLADKVALVITEG